MLILTVNAQDLKERTKVRSGTSVAANYRSTCRSCSHAEFISKIGVVEEKVDETSLWPELIVADKFLPENKIASLLSESNQLITIMAASHISASRSKREGHSANSKSAIRNQQS